jgi:hypothetical protein
MQGGSAHANGRKTLGSRWIRTEKMGRVSQCNISKFTSSTSTLEETC